jgi:hypothetical protein
VIGRVWHGWTKPEHADAYEAMLKPELLPGISKAKGYRGSYLLRRGLGKNGSKSKSGPLEIAEVEFITILLFDALEDIKAVAGRDYEQSIVPEERQKYLSRHEKKAAHYEVVATNGL